MTQDINDSQIDLETPTDPTPDVIELEEAKEVETPEVTEIEETKEVETPQVIEHIEDSVEPSPSTSEPVTEPVVEEIGVYSTSSYELEGDTLKIPLAVKGNWFHPKYGQVTITDKDLISIKTNFDNGVLGHPPYITYGHIKDMSPSYSKVDTIDAELKKGDISNMLVEGDTLFGISRVSKETASLVKNGEYEFNSPEIISNFKSKSTGEMLGPVIMRTSLTNSPFLPMGRKVTLLSQSAEAELPLIIKLSSIMPETNSTTAPVVEAVETTPEVAQVKEPNESIDAAAIIKATTDSLSAVWSQQADALKSSYEQAVADLKDQVDGLQSELERQKTLAYSFSQKLSEEEKQKKSSYLASKGLSPAVISRYSLIADAINSSAGVVKFSQGESEVELSILTAIENLLIESCEKVDVKQYGQSSTSNTLDDDILALAKANREAAK